MLTGFWNLFMTFVLAPLGSSSNRTSQLIAALQQRRGVTFNIVLPSDQDLCCIRKDSYVKGPVQLILSKANKF